MSDTAPGVMAMWSASWPSDIDLSCGFQARRSPGTRSRTRRVVCASCSSSCSMLAMIDMGLLLSSVDGAICLGLLPHPIEQLRPAERQALSDLVRDEPERGMPEG